MSEIIYVRGDATVPSVWSGVGGGVTEGDTEGAG